MVLGYSYELLQFDWYVHAYQFTASLQRFIGQSYVINTFSLTAYTANIGICTLTTEFVPAKPSKNHDETKNAPEDHTNWEKCVRNFTNLGFHIWKKEIIKKNQL